jgi:hypothetical protein
VKVQIPSPSSSKIKLPVSVKEVIAIELLLRTPTKVSSTPSYGDGSTTAVDALTTVPTWLIVITVLHPVPAGSGGCTKLVPVAAPGQIVPADAKQGASTHNTKAMVLCIAFKILRSELGQ